jgi:hypothetical protein
MTTKIQITERALMQRIQRKLNSRDEVLRKTSSRSWRMQSNVGDFYIVDARHNYVVASCLDLEELGRELKAIRPYEELA